MLDLRLYDTITQCIYSTLLHCVKVASMYSFFQNRFRGYCIMYADVIDDKIMFGATANCTFVTYLHVITSVIYGGILAAMYSFGVVKHTKGGDFL